MMKPAKAVVLFLAFILLVAGVMRPINVSATTFDKADTIREIRVNGRPIVAPPPVINEYGFVMLPLRAVAEALGFVVEWDAIERRADVGGVYSVWAGTPFISSGGVMTAHKFYTDSYIIDSRTFVSISFFTVINGVSAEVNDGIVSVERQSLFWNATEFHELQLNFWSYNLGFPQHMNLLYDYKTLYDVVTHEEGAAWAIWTDTTIQNFEFIEVGHGDTGTGLMYFYPGRTLHLIEEFTPERPFSFRSHFGTMPRIAITFLDENGVRLYFTIQQSGRDGSLEIMPFPLDERNPF